MAFVKWPYALMQSLRARGDRTRHECDGSDWLGLNRRVKARPRRATGSLSNVYKTQTRSLLLSFVGTSHTQVATRYTRPQLVSALALDRAKGCGLKGCLVALWESALSELPGRITFSRPVNLMRARCHDRPEIVSFQERSLRRSDWTYSHVAASQAASLLSYCHKGDTCRNEISERSATRKLRGGLRTGLNRPRRIEINGLLDPIDNKCHLPIHILMVFAVRPKCRRYPLLDSP